MKSGKSEIYLHVGLSKCASTFFQWEVFPNIEGINYINETKMRECGIQIKNGKNIISNDRWSGVPFDSSTNDREIIFNGLKALFPNAKIILGIREKDDMIKSLYSAYIIKGGTKSYDWFMERLSKSEKYDYDKLFSLLSKLFGKNNIHVFRLEELKRNHHSCVKGVCDFMGVEVPKYGNRKYNPKMSNRKIWLCRLLNKIFNSTDVDVPGRHGFYSNKMLMDKL